MRENPEIVWEMYQSLEKEFLNYLEYVPLTPQHYEVWSYPLVNLFNNIGSSVDSFFKNAIYCESLNDYPNIDEIRAKDQHTMKTYRDIFETRYKISNRQIFELRNFSSIYPFMDWSDENAPDWWRRYTDIKHDRFRNKERATLKATMDALAGLFTLFLTHKETLSTLIDYNIIHTPLTRDSSKRALLPGAPFENLGGQRAYVKTGLFGYVFENMKYPSDDSYKSKMLSPTRHSADLFSRIVFFKITTEQPTDPNNFIIDIQQTAVNSRINTFQHLTNSPEQKENPFHRRSGSRFISRIHDGGITFFEDLPEQPFRHRVYQKTEHHQHG